MLYVFICITLDSVIDTFTQSLTPLRNKTMTKSEAKECLKLQAWKNSVPVDMLARSYSSLIRSAMTQKSKNEILVFAAELPAVIQHPEFII